MKKEDAIVIGNYRVHQLKTVDPYFSAVKSGDKPFEVRKFDRDYQVNDFLFLTHYDPIEDKLGEVVTKRITYMLTDKPYVPEGYVVLGMKDDNIVIDF